jgi:DNA ligase-4
VPVDELREIMEGMPKLEMTGSFDKAHFLEDLESRGKGLSELRGWMLSRCVVSLCPASADDEKTAERLSVLVRYAGGRCVSDRQDQDVTHVVIVGDDAMETGEMADKLRRELSERRRMPRIVSGAWVQDCWTEKTVLDEEKYTVQ